MKQIDFSNTRINGGFWAQKQSLVREVSSHAIYKRFKETGRFDAFKFDKSVNPHFFWDSDVAKWIEGVAYLASEKREPELEAIVDELVSEIAKNRDECGYFNIFHQIIEPENRFKIRDHHELYCAGHLMEAGVAYYEATGKRELLDLMCDYADYIERRFLIDKDTDFVTPGHEEIELALVRLYDCTGEKRYLDLAKFFVDQRGANDEQGYDWANNIYNQSHKPAREQFTAEGHAVRAVYLYCAMADIARKFGDVALKDACERIFEDISERKMYITGGIGSSHLGEAFTAPYDLPNLISYTESCAALGLALFAHRMLLIDNDSRYADVVERAIYNGFLSSISLDGTAFFYTNPLEIMPALHTRDASTTDSSMWLPIMQRKEVFDCSCCPPNILRFIASIANFLYTCDDNAIYVHQFMQSESTINVGSRAVKISQKTDYPYNGKIELCTDSDVRLAIRIPEWCNTYKGETVKGYAFFDAKANEPITIDFEMKPFFVGANPRVAFDCGKYAVQNGPIVYCMESHDNGKTLRDLYLDSSADFSASWNDALGVPTLTIDAYRRKDTDKLYYRKGDDTTDLYKTSATLIPYFAFANRGEAEMQVWHFVK